MSDKIVKIDEEHMRLLVKDAAEEGANNALAKLGLNDEKAGKDIKELRDLMSMYRVVTSEALRTMTRTITVAIIGMLAMGAAIKTGIIKIVAGG